MCGFRTDAKNNLYRTRCHIWSPCKPLTFTQNRVDKKGCKENFDLTV